MISIDNWILTSTDTNPYLAPELIKMCLYGIVSNHPKHKDGTYVTTSHIVGYDYLYDAVITVSGSRYKLGEPNPGYEAQFPNAKQRFIDSLSK
jgi:hypothetical protein